MMDLGRLSLKIDADVADAMRKCTEMGEHVQELSGVIRDETSAMEEFLAQWAMGWIAVGVAVVDVITELVKSSPLLMMYLKMFGSWFGMLADIIIMIFTPALDTLLDIMWNFLDWFDNLSDAEKLFVTAVGGIVIALAILKKSVIFTAIGIVTTIIITNLKILASFTITGAKIILVWIATKLGLIGITSSLILWLTAKWTAFKIKVIAIWGGIKSGVLLHAFLTKVGVIATWIATKVGVIAISLATNVGVIAIWIATKVALIAIWIATKVAVIAISIAIKVGVIATWIAMKTGAIAISIATKVGVIATWIAMKTGVIAEAIVTKVVVIATSISTKVALIANAIATKIGVIANAIATKIGVIATWIAMKTGLISISTATKIAVNATFVAMKIGILATMIATKIGIIAAWIGIKLAILKPIIIIVAKILFFIGFLVLLGKAIHTLARVVWDNIPQAFKDTFFGALDSAKSAINSIISYITGAGGRMLAAGREFGNALTRGVNETARNAVAAARNAVAEIRNLLPFSDAKEGPLADLMESGESLMKTFAQGISKGEHYPKVALEKGIAIPEAEITPIQHGAIQPKAGAPGIAPATPVEQIINVTIHAKIQNDMDLHKLAKDIGELVGKDIRRAI